MHKCVNTKEMQTMLAVKKKWSGITQTLCNRPENQLYKYVPCLTDNFKIL